MTEYAITAVNHGDGPDEEFIGVIHGDGPRNALNRIFEFLLTKCADEIDKTLDVDDDGIGTVVNGELQINEESRKSPWAERLTRLTHADGYHFYEADTLQFVSSEEFYEKLGEKIKVKPDEQ